MAVDIGAEAIDRANSQAGAYTRINKKSPASIAGVITSIDIWAATDITGLRVGTFYTTNGNTLKCRASEAIAGTITAGSKVNKVVSIAVEIGDYIGMYFADGQVDYGPSEGDDLWYVSGEYIDPADETTYALLADYVWSLGGYISPAGWTGEIAGVTNPASIMGVDVENIETVKGVASG